MRFWPLIEVKETRTLVTIAAFAYAAPAWVGMSQLVAQGLIGNSIPISIKRPITPIATFVMAVRWTDSAGATHRYKLWDAGVLYFPIYDGEQIGLNAVIEVWSVQGSLIALLPSDLSLPISPLNQPTYCPACSNTTVTIGVATQPY